MADSALVGEIEQFLYREARLLDSERFAEWLDLFTEDCHYWMPAREVRGRGEPTILGPGSMAYFDDDKAFLKMRIARFDTGLAHAEEPPSRTWRSVSNVEVIDEGAAGVTAHSKILVFQARLDRSENFFVGRREDLLRRGADGLRIAKRKIVLDQMVLPRALSIFF